MAEKENSKFKTKIGLVAATLGSAVGLGSIWRFPAEAQQNGGGAFLLVYLGCVLLLGIPVMIAELSLGRAGGADSVGSFKNLSPKRSLWWIGGMLGVISSYLIISFYMVVAGWTFEYLWDSITGSLYSGVGQGEGLAQTGAIFHERMERYISSDIPPLISTYVMILLNMGVLMLGVQKGIERVSNILMPALFVLLAVFCVYALTMSGAGAGVEYFFKPDFSKVTWPMVGNALGQTFFSLSLGTGILVTYASYYPDSTNLARTSTIVSLLTTLVAVMMGVIIFPTVFTFGLSPEGMRGTTLVFVSLPEVFTRLPYPQLWSVMFFTLLLAAALTSTISISEVSVAFVERRFGKSRGKATLITMLPLFVISAICSLSFGSLSDVTILGMNIFNFLDTFATNIFLPVTALAVVVFIGWFAPKGTLERQISNSGRVNRHVGTPLRFIIRYVAPVMILIILLSGFFK